MFKITDSQTDFFKVQDSMQRIISRSYGHFEDNEIFGNFETSDFSNLLRLKNLKI